MPSSPSTLYPFSSLGSISSLLDIDLSSLNPKTFVKRTIAAKTSHNQKPTSIPDSHRPSLPTLISPWSFTSFADLERSHTPTSILFLESPKSAITSSTDRRDDYSRVYHHLPFNRPLFNTPSSLHVPNFAMKYKKVADRVKPVPTTLPEDYRIVRYRHPDPLKGLPVIPTNPPDVIEPSLRFTAERMAAFPISDELWPKERLLVLWLVKAHEETFAWDESERGSFKEEFYPPVLIPTIEHIPWALKNIPIPPALFDRVVAIVREKIAAGVYEFSNSSYRSRWFCVLKKDKQSLRLVHDLQPLNAVSIRDPSVPMSPDEIAEMFACHARYSSLDLMVAFDQRPIDPRSRDLTTFQTPLGVLRLTSLPMGYTNSQQILHADIVFALSDEIPKYTIPYIDDVNAKGPERSHRNPDGSYATIPENDGVRVDVWEHLQIINRLLQRVGAIGGTFSAKKAVIAVLEADILGHRCSAKGRVVDNSRVAAINDWADLESQSDVRHFLGTVGVLRHFIADFARIAAPLNRLLTKDADFVFGDDERQAFNALKLAVSTSPALRTLDYRSGGEIIFSVDSSNVGFGAILSQIGEDGVRYPVRFFSRTWDATQRNYSQAKCELFGVFRALHDAKRYLIGVDHFILEVDASYLKGMINNPDLQPSATINRWIAGILLFPFKLVHVPAAKHTGPDGLSRRPAQPSDAPQDDSYEDFVDHQYSLVMHGSLPNPHLREDDESDDEPPPVIPPPQPEERVRTHAPTGDLHYSAFPRSLNAKRFDTDIPTIIEFLRTGNRPSLSHDQLPAFIAKASRFFLHNHRLWRKSLTSTIHQLFVKPERRVRLLLRIHDELGHKGFRTATAHLERRFWWPGLRNDVAWYLKTCHECQIRQFTRIHIPPTTAPPATLFSRVYIDVMHLPKSCGCSYLVQARCSLTGYPEYRALRHDRAAALAEFVFQDIICRWGAVAEIVHDNGPSFSGAFAECLAKFNINPIRISPYNSRANLVERRHRDVREALLRVGEPKRWVQNAPFVFFAERITVQRTTGYSPYYLVHGVDPLLPFDITEHTFLFPSLNSAVSTADLLTSRARALQRRAADLRRVHKLVYESRLRSADAFVRRYESRVQDFNCRPGDLVLARNARIEMEASRKAKPRYLGPFVVVRRTTGGSYILSELDGAILAQRFAAFRIIPYHARTPQPVSAEEVTRRSSQRLDDLAQQHSTYERSTAQQSH